MYAPKGKLPKINSGYAIRLTKLFLSCSEMHLLLKYFDLYG